MSSSYHENHELYYHNEQHVEMHHESNDIITFHSAHDKPSIECQDSVMTSVEMLQSELMESHDSEMFFDDDTATLTSSLDVNATSSIHTISTTSSCKVLPLPKLPELPPSLDFTLENDREIPGVRHVEPSSESRKRTRKLVNLRLTKSSLMTASTIIIEQQL